MTIEFIGSGIIIIIAMVLIFMIASLYSMNIILEQIKIEHEKTRHLILKTITRGNHE